MLVRNIEIDVATSTWPLGSTIPRAFRPLQQPEIIDLKQALVMLGTMTMPNLISPASPARFWAWLRYAIAVSAQPDLRITMDFADLDPHQKGILSDDFGVAVSTQWLYDRLGGFRDIVDGRRFMLRFSHLMKRRKVAKANVGPSKAPDFVVQDLAGKWHVLECKGTQSGRSIRNGFLKTARQQKNIIQIKNGVRGERLAAGLAISNDSNRKRSQLRIVDPEDETDSELVLDDKDAEQMKDAAHRIAVARALGVVGLNEAAMEAWLPEQIADAADFLRPSEALRLRQSRQDRSEKATRQIKDRALERFQRDHRLYQGRSFSFSMPQLGIASDVSSVGVRVGINEDLLRVVEEQPATSQNIGELCERGEGVSITPYTSKGHPGANAPRPCLLCCETQQQVCL